MKSAGLQSVLAAGVWRASSSAGDSAVRAVPTRFTALNKLLSDGGWPQRSLIELLCACGVGEMRLLMPVLAPLMRARQTLALIEPPHIPYPRALMAHGVMHEQFLMVRARDRAQRLWAIEQTLKSGGVSAVVAWLPENNGCHISFQALRRLQLAAQGMQCDPGLVFLLRSVTARAASSPAPLRIELTVTLDIFKRRGMPAHSVLQIALPGAPARRIESLFEELPAAEAAEVAIDAVDCRLSA